MKYKIIKAETEEESDTNEGGEKNDE